MNEEKRYPIDEALFEEIIPTIRRLEGLAVVLDTLGHSIGRDKHALWERIYAEYPGLRGKPLIINEFKKEITFAPQPETSIIETLPEG